MVKLLKKNTIALFVLCALVACSSPIHKKEDNVVTSSSNSQPAPLFSFLNEDGVRQIEATGRARFDVRDRTITNAQAGVPPDFTKDVLIGKPGGADIELTLVGPEGEATTTTQTLWITHLDDGRFTEIIFFRAFHTAEDVNQELMIAIDTWGILPSKTESWKTIAIQAGVNKEKWNLGAGVGPTGLIVDMNASIKKETQVFNYIVDLDPLNYNPENIANIRSTGIGKRVVN
jgi:hypothetical protein